MFFSGLRDFLSGLVGGRSEGCSLVVEVDTRSVSRRRGPRGWSSSMDKSPKFDESGAWGVYRAGFSIHPEAGLSSGRIPPVALA